MPVLTKKQFYEALIKGRIVSKKVLDELDKEAKKSARNVEDFLVERGYLSEDALAELRVKASGMPIADISQLVDPGVFDFVPETMAKNLSVIPIRKDGNKLLVAMTDPEDIETIAFIRKRAGLAIVPQYAPRKEIMAAIERIKAGGIPAEVLAEEEGGEGVVAAVEIGASVIRLVDNIIQNAVRADASDIHFEPQENDLLIRFRIDGILRDTMRLSKNVAPGVVARIKVLANLKLDEHRLPQDGRFKMKIGDGKFAFRVSIMPVFDGEKAAVRILPEEAKLFTFDELGFFPDQQEIIKRAIKRPFGLILATGPTGSGKTTTLYTILQLLNTREVNISTVEDPIEYRIPGVNQTQVRPDIGLSFANGLRSLLRQDPNILMVGEVRDNDTAALAIHAALTGHIVLSTLHTNNAAGAVPRLIDMKAEAFLIASTLSLIIAQRLVRKLCPESRIPYKLSPTELTELGKTVNVMGLNDVFRRRGVIGPNETIESVTFYRPGPSQACPDGYKSRIGIHEMIELSETIRNLIFRGASGDEIAGQARADGMLTMQEMGFIMAAQGITSIEEVLRTTKE